MVLRSSAIFAAGMMLVGCGDPVAGPQGEAGLPGISSLVRLDAEAEGTNCARGGTAIRSGADKNADGVLDDDEVTSTRFVCNGVGETGADGADGENGNDGEDGQDGADGAQALVKLEDEPAGDNCDFGGTRVLSGLDANGNDTLDETEVTGTTYVCNGFGAGAGTTIDGDVFISNAGEAQVLRGIRHITGQLIILSYTSEEIALPELERVDGRLAIWQNQNLTKVSLPNVTTVGGRLAITNNRVLETVELPLLDAVGGSFEVSNNEALPAFELPLLATVGEYVYFDNNEALADIALPALTAVEESFDIDRSAALTSLSLPKLKTVGEAFLLSSLETLVSFEAPELSTAGEVSVRICAVLETVSFPALVEATILRAHYNPQLVSLSAPLLAVISDSLEIGDNDALETLSLPELRTVGEYFGIYQNDNLPQCQVDAILAALDEMPPDGDIDGNDDAGVCD